MRLRRPSLWLILPAMYSTWFVHVKSDDIKIPSYLKLFTLFTLWSKILLSNFLLLSTSIHWFSWDSKLACDRLAISLWPTSHDLASHWAPGKMSRNSKSRRLATSRPFGERPTTSDEVARGRLVSLEGFAFAFRAKNGKWRHSHLGFQVSFASPWLQ